ncbi:MAG: virginiamycin B lyase family protein [Nitrosotalea sp.]
MPTIPNSYAHALIAKSDPTPSQSLPTPPSKVDVYFTDPVDIRYSTIKVLDPSGNEIQNKDEHYITSDQSALSVSLPAGLLNGVYTVSTKVLDQTDGHVTENGFVFAVGVAAPTATSQPKVSYSDVISIPDTIARFPALIGQVIVVGIAFSTLWLWSPVSRLVKLQQRFAETRSKIDKRAMMFMLIGSAIVFASGFSMIAAVAYSIHAGFSDAVSTKFGQMWLIRMMVSSVLLGVSLVFYFKQKKINSILPKSQSAIILGVGIVVLSTTSIIGHGAATGQLGPLLFDFIHNLAASLWVGGVIYIDFIIISKLKQLGNEEISSPILSIIIPKFSTVVLFILGTITISGPFLLFLLESNLALTLVSIYGKILIVKLSLAAVMIAAGAYHQFEVHKHALRDVVTSRTTPTMIQNQRPKITVLSKFGASAKIESIAGILLIVSVAVLVNSGLPATEFQDILQSQQPTSLAFGIGPNNLQNVFTETRFVENGSRVVMSIDPYFVGSNDITISFFDSNRNPLDIQSVLLELTQIDKSIGPIKIDTQQIAKGIYSAKTDSLTIPGNWQAHVEGIPTAAGSLSLVADYDLSLKPKVSQLLANIHEYKIDNNSLPLYPVYDKVRNVVWVGDTAIKSGQLIEFSLDSKKYTAHKIEGTNIITYAAMDYQGTLWYVDPLSKILGRFNPNNNSNQVYPVPVNGAISGLALDSSGNAWLTISTTDELIEFNPVAKNFTSIELTKGSVPIGIAIDNSNGQLWIAESGTGKLANIDPSNNYKVTEYEPGQNKTLASPTAILIDPLTGKIFVTEHDGTAVSLFDPLLKTFTQYQLDPQGLPFGMAFDANHDLWIAQHTLNKVAVLDPRTGETNEFSIPSSSSFTQWITADSQGNIILAEQRANTVGIVTTTASPTSSQQSSQTASSPIPQLSFSYADIAAPSIVTSLIAIAFFYSRSTLDLKKSLKHTREMLA